MCLQLLHADVVYHVLLYFVWYVCFAMYDITDVVFSISNKEQNRI